MMVSGCQINKTDMELRHGLMVLSIKATSLWAAKMEMASSFGLTVAPTKALLKTIASMAKVCTPGLMADNTRANGA